MSFLTQAFLDYETAARCGLRDVYDWHQLTWQAFPDRDGAARDFLTRLDRRERDQTFRLLIVSPRSPRRPDKWPDTPEAWQTREITPAFFAHKHYRFQLRANPTKRENVSRKRLPLRIPQEQMEWMVRKATRAGFVVNADTLRVIPEGREWFCKEKGQQQGFHHSVEYEGMLTVTDSALFQSAFNLGIGSAKAFGFGLLALVPCG